MDTAQYSVYNVSDTDYVNMIKQLNIILDKTRLEDNASAEFYKACDNLKTAFRRHICSRIIQKYNTALTDYQSDKVRAQNILQNPDLAMFSEVKDTMQSRIQTIDDRMKVIKENVQNLLDMMTLDEDKLEQYMRKNSTTDSSLNVPVKECPDDSNCSFQIDSQNTKSTISTEQKDIKTDAEKGSVSGAVEKSGTKAFEFKENNTTGTVKINSSNDANITSNSVSVSIRSDGSEDYEKILKKCSDCIQENTNKCNSETNTLKNNSARVHTATKSTVKSSPKYNYDECIKFIRERRNPDGTYGDIVGITNKVYELNGFRIDAFCYELITKHRITDFARLSVDVAEDYQTARYDFHRILVPYVRDILRSHIEVKSPEDAGFLDLLTDVVVKTTFESTLKHLHKYNRPSLKMFY